MDIAAEPASGVTYRPASVPFWQKEDWWAAGAALLIVAAAIGALWAGGSLAWIAVSPPKWTSGAQLAGHFASAWPRYAVQFLLWSALIVPALSILGQRPGAAFAGFAFLYALTLVIITLGQWAGAVRYNLEPPLLALLLGLVLANAGVLPARLGAGFRVEFFIKLGVVLLGATLPFTVLLYAGPTALLQASVVSLVTFGVIFAVARALGLDPRFAAVLAVGGAVCGVSAAIAIGAAVGARRTDVAVTISVVILWAIVMIFVLPFAAQALGLPPGVGGAWIGTSEFADAAGLAAAQAYGGLAPAGTGSPEQAVAAFTLMKVVGRDIWIGVWALVLSVVAASRWAEPGDLPGGANAGEIWRRFPKFVLGFLLASLAVTLAAQAVGHAAYASRITPGLIAPVRTLRNFAFTFGFLSIGLTTRGRDLAGIGLRPAAAFSVGVAVNLALGFVLSVVVFGHYWARIGQ